MPDRGDGPYAAVPGRPAGCKLCHPGRREKKCQDYIEPICDAAGFSWACTSDVDPPGAVEQGTFLNLAARCLTGGLGATSSTMVSSGDEEQNGGFEPSNGGNGGSFGGDEEQPTSRSLPATTLPGLHPNVPGPRPVPHVPTSPEHDDVASALFASAALVSGHNELAGVALAAQGHPMAGMAAMMMGDGNEGEHVDAPPPSPPSSPRGLVAAADGVAAIDSLVGADTDATSRGYVPKMTNTNPGFHLNGPDGVEPGFAFNGVWQPSQQQSGAKCPDVPALMHTLQLAEDSVSACQQTCLSYAQYHKFFLGYAGKDFCCQYKEGGAPGECQISPPITATNVPYLPDSEYTAFFFHPTAAANGV